MLRWAFTALGLATALACGQAVAQEAINPGVPEQLGTNTTYTLTGLNPNFQPGVMYWTIIESDSWCITQRTPPSGQTATYSPPSYTWTVPGTFILQCILYYSPNSGPDPPPGPVTITRTVNIGVPTISSVSGIGDYSDYCDPNNPPTSAGGPGGQPGAYVYFQLTSNGLPVGTNNSMYAQELITNVNGGGQSGGGSNGWVPSSTTDQLFYLSAGPTGWAAICDFKYCATPPTGVFPQGPFVTYSQQLRVIWKDYSGKWQSQTVGAYNFCLFGSNNPNQWTTEDN